MSEEPMINVVRAMEALRVRLGDVERERDQLRADLEAARTEIERMKGLGSAAQRVLDDMDQGGFVSREGQELLRQAIRDAWLDLP